MFRYINSDTAVPGEVGPQKDMAISEAVPLVLGRGINMDRDMDRDMGMDRVISRGMDTAMSRGMDLDRVITLRRDAISMGVPLLPRPSPPQPQLSVLPLRCAQVIKTSHNDFEYLLGQKLDNNLFSSFAPSY